MSKLRPQLAHLNAQSLIYYNLALTRRCNPTQDRKSTRLNSSHSQISYAVFCLKKKKEQDPAHDDQPRLSPPLLEADHVPDALARRSQIDQHHAEFAALHVHCVTLPRNDRVITR